uniref:Uncharacterized protein n=1 Tax=Anguilla anguilla TaxID=7936 RepID=A0A0E9SRZ8_ANGAN
MVPFKYCIHNKCCTSSLQQTLLFQSLPALLAHSVNKIIKNAFYFLPSFYSNYTITDVLQFLKILN